MPSAVQTPKRTICRTTTAVSARAARMSGPSDRRGVTRDPGPSDDLESGEHGQDRESPPPDRLQRRWSGVDGKALGRRKAAVEEVGEAGQQRRTGGREGEVASRGVRAPAQEHDGREAAQREAEEQRPVDVGEALEDGPAGHPGSVANEARALSRAEGRPEDPVRRPIHHSQEWKRRQTGRGDSRHGLQLDPYVSQKWSAARRSPAYRQRPTMKDRKNPICGEGAMGGLGFTFTWYGHACVEIATDGGRHILIHPWVGNPTPPPPPVTCGDRARWPGGWSCPAPRRSGPSTTAPSPSSPAHPTSCAWSWRHGAWRRWRSWRPSTGSRPPATLYGAPQPPSDQRAGRARCSASSRVAEATACSGDAGALRNSPAWSPRCRSTTRSMGSGPGTQWPPMAVRSTANEGRMWPRVTVERSPISRSRRRMAAGMRA